MHIYVYAQIQYSVTHNMRFRYIHSTYTEIVYTPNRRLNNIKVFHSHIYKMQLDYYKQQLDQCKQQLQGMDIQCSPMHRCSRQSCTKVNLQI